MNTINGVYQLWCKNKLSNPFAVAIMIAVINDNSLGERFLVSKTDMLLS